MARCEEAAHGGHEWFATLGDLIDFLVSSLARAQPARDDHHVDEEPSLQPGFRP